MKVYWEYKSILETKKINESLQVHVISVPAKVRARLRTIYLVALYDIKEKRYRADNQHWFFNCGQAVQYFQKVS